MVQEAWKAGATKCLSKARCSPKQVIDAVRSVLQPPAAKPAQPTAQPAPAAVAQKSDAVPAFERAGDADAEFQAELRREFIESLAGTLATLRAQLQALIKADSEMARLKQIHDLYRKVHALTGNAGIAGLLQIAQMSDALEALLKELNEKPANITASTLRTAALSIDFLGYLFEHGTVPDRQGIPPANILVVDDEAISRRAVTYSLEKAKLKSVTVEDPQTALRLLSENKFDLIFLDVDMPDMNGFELCTRLRNLPAHRKTPVVFVTSLTDFESRASSTMSGGNDFIAKPFLFIELAVKALIYVLRGQLEAARGVIDLKQAGA
jgi:CheY-like chemotaxis protein